MTTGARSRGIGLRMPVLALAISASIVAGVFVSASPALSVDGPGNDVTQCLTVTAEASSVVMSSLVRAGATSHAEGAGWSPGVQGSRGFVIVTLDDGQETRAKDATLPSWVPPAVARNRAAWAVAEVSPEGTFALDLPVPATWTVGSQHRVSVGDGVSGTYVELQVSVIDAEGATPSCRLTPTEPATDLPGGGSDAPTEPTGAFVPPASPDIVTPSGESKPSPVDPGAAPTSAGASPESAVEASSPAPSSPATSAQPSSANPSGSTTGSPAGSGVGTEATPEATASSEQQRVSASQIGPKAHSEKQATNQAAREQESRLGVWVLAGGAVLALLGAIVTVSIVKRGHAPVH